MHILILFTFIQSQNRISRKKDDREMIFCFQVSQKRQMDTTPQVNIEATLEDFSKL